MLDPFPAAILALSLNTAAFMAVLVHNSVSAIPQGQWEAGLALGHSRGSTFIHQSYLPYLFQIMHPRQ